MTNFTKSLPKNLSTFELIWATSVVSLVMRSIPSLESLTLRGSIELLSQGILGTQVLVISLYTI